MLEDSVKPKQRRTRSKNSSAEKPFRTPLPTITYPEELPVSGRREEIARAIESHQVIIVCGETGSGKTTQLPKICLELGRGEKGLVGHTQPRRIAASSTAKRIAQELNSPMGEHVGFKVRFTDTVQKGASVKLMTDGILLAETQTDPLLKQYDTLIIDEAHERSLNIDFLLGYLKQILPRRPDLKVIITSATIDAERFSKHFATKKQSVPIIEVSGRLYPVDVRYRPIEEPKTAAQVVEGKAKNAAQKQQRDLMDAVGDAVDELTSLGSGDVLVFLPGEREIRDAAEILRKRQPQHVIILPLYARLSAKEQERVFQTTNARRIILATNVAETSLTVPGVRFVVDSGLARVKRYSYRNKVEQLQVEAISQSSANQRSGRCGRVASGVCVRLYSEEDYALRPPFSDPEILRSSLASVIMRMKSLRLTDVETFPFLEAPLGRAIADGYQLLQELGALNDRNQLTRTGRELAKLPLDPRVGRMILAAKEQTCLSEILIIASALSVQDPRDRPMDKQEQADQAHQKFREAGSEFMSYIKIWKWFEDAIINKKSNRKLQETCRENFLSQVRLREWRDVHSQLLTIAKEQGWHLNATPATNEQVHMALLVGLLGNVGFKVEGEPHYLGARSIKFHIWPGSSLNKKAGKWVMSAELVDTSRLYARCLAQIQPEWLERAGAHLLKKSYNEPRWEKSRAQVTAFESATLYGLPVYTQRRVDYARIDVAHAREIFIREALLEGDFETRAVFFAHNQKMVREVENLEHKARRFDVLVDAELIFAFYDQHLPQDICSGITFEKWVKDLSADDQKTLQLDRESLMRHEAAGVTVDLFPKRQQISGVEMGMTYHFEPGSMRDGVTLTVPLYALNQISDVQSEWLVPGMLKEKVQLLLKSLPQRYRRHCVPLPQYAADFCERIQESARFKKIPLIDALKEDLREQCQLTVSVTDFKQETLPTHLAMNFKVIDDHGRQLDMGRNLEKLRAELSQEARAQFQAILGSDAKTKGGKTNKQRGRNASSVQKQTAASPAPEAEKIVSWSFGELSEFLEITRGRQTLRGYPALVDKKTHCELEVYDDPDMAMRVHEVGLRRLFALQLKEQVKYLSKHIPQLQQMGMQYMTFGTQEELRDEIIDLSLGLSCIKSPLPTDEKSFITRKDEARSRLGLMSSQVAKLASDILSEYHALSRKLQSIKSHRDAFGDIQEQLGGLVHSRFLVTHDYARLAHIPRYLKAIGVRIDKLREDPRRDAARMSEWQNAARPYERLKKDDSVRMTEQKVIDYRWMLEELRVSLFAQELKTPMPVSVKRLEKVWTSIQR